VGSSLSRTQAADDVGLIAAWAADGRGLLSVAALGLAVSGLFGWFLAFTDQLLPHDVAWLTISEHELRAIADGRLVHFMAHDRAAFGGTLVAIGLLYLWLVRFPLSQGRAWAWWALAVSGGLGFVSFLEYLGTGYLDSWHAVATLALLVPFVLGLVRSRHDLRGPMGIRTLAVPGARPPLRSRGGLGRGLLLATAVGMLVAGTVIATIGTAVVFVPEDLAFLGLDRAALDAIDVRLVPLIAHDRAGFGASLATTGLTVLASVYCGRPSRSLWEALVLAGLAGFGSAVAFHGVIGYLEPSHVGPAVLAAAVFVAGLVLSRPAMVGDRHAARDRVTRA
jgi:hypothetical protein